MKKVFTVLILLAVVAGCVLAAGCTAANTQVSQKVPDDVAYTVTVSKEGPTTYNVGDIFALKFLTNPTTGYDWQVVKGNEILYNTFRDAGEKDTGLDGAPSNVTFWFQAEEEGDYPIELVYARPWDVENTSISSFSDVMPVKKSDLPNANGPKTSITFDSFNINPKAGSYVKIVTAANPTTGYYYKPSGDGLTIIEDYQVDDESLVGSPGKYIWYVTANKAGDYSFKATYQKAGSDEVLSLFTVPLKFT